MKKIISLMVALFLLVMTGACMTPKLYGKTTVRSFEEKIGSFLITKNGEQFIMVGEKFHYTFKASETFKFILTWSENKRVQVSFSNFIVNDEKVRGNYSLSIDHIDELSPEIKKMLFAKGFSNNNNKLFYHEWLNGTRYVADKALPTALKFNQPYTITMQEQDFGIPLVGRILLTPLAVTADGVLVIGAIPVFIVGAPIVFIADKVHQLSK